MGVIEQAAKRLEQLRAVGDSKLPSDNESVLGYFEGGVGGREGEHPEFIGDKRLGQPLVSHQVNPALRGGQRPVSRSVDIDVVRLGRIGLVTPDEPRSQIAEEFRSIKRPLIRNAQGKSSPPIRRGNLIMVTSALSGEGKSTCSANLAISMAMELDSTVLLVDADVAKPSIPDLLGFQPDLGLLDVVADRSIDLGDVLLRTNIEKLSLCPSGRANPRATELLASETMALLLDEMSSRYSDRIIVFDSPPLLLTNEAHALAAHVGQVVLVVEAERTTHAELKQALASVESCPVKLLLLNKDRTFRKGAGYGYGYGHDRPFGQSTQA